MKIGDLIVGRVMMNPLKDGITPCLKLDLFDGLSDGELVLLEVKNCRWIKELNEDVSEVKDDE